MFACLTTAYDDQPLNFMILSPKNLLKESKRVTLMLLPDLLASRISLMVKQKEAILTTGAMKSATWGNSLLLSYNQTTKHNSITEIKERSPLRLSFVKFTQFQGINLPRFLRLSHSSNGVMNQRKKHGRKTRTVLWKHDVKSGWSVYQVREEFQSGPEQIFIPTILKSYLIKRQVLTEPSIECLKSL